MHTAKFRRIHGNFIRKITREMFGRPARVIGGLFQKFLMMETKKGILGSALNTFPGAIPEGI